MFHDSDQNAYYLAFRQNGRIKQELWGKNWRQLANNVDRLLLEAKETSYDLLEVNLTYNYQYVKRNSTLLKNIYRGVKGLSFKVDRKIYRYSPTQIIAQNKSFQKLINPFQNKIVEDLLAFDAHQFFIKLNEPETKIITTFRGNQIVKPAEVTQENVRKLSIGMTNWMLKQVSKEGPTTYKYWPSRKLDKQPTSNNMIRQWMATVCLTKLVQNGFDSAKEKLHSNLSYNLDTFYHQNKALGLIPFNNKVKLGSVALAALGISESPFHLQYKQQEESLNRTIHSLWLPNGRFKTFYASSMDHNHNFYPGEALLYWVHRYKKTKNPILLKKIMTSFRYYKKWHLNPRNRNPAFIPWHTQAYYALWEVTHNSELKDFIFEMNDWLIKIQQWDNASFEDIKGRFYALGKRYGPPHASSTGVYLEGLIDAYKLARKLKDKSRVKAYKVTILRGLRSLMQLQFVDDIDMFYISKKNKVRGGLRTTVYSNEIRIDNVQHGLMAVMKILKSFSGKDYDLNSLK